jgi:hypothetical protein
VAGRQDHQGGRHHLERPGSASATITYAIAWNAATATASTCVAITGAASSTYTLTSAERQRRIIAAALC